MQQKLFVANWKMNKPFSEALSFSQEYKSGLNELSTDRKEVVVCPSFPALFPLAQLFADTMVSIGAQNCSAHEKGSYTGQVSAHSLKEVGCEYCIIGHSEQRNYCGQTNEEIAQKTAQLVRHEIQPIICIGESEQEYKDKKAFDILTTQLKPIIPQLKDKPCVIAYEPVWSIGTGIVPEASYLAEVVAWVKTQVPDSCRLLYGGSVDDENAAQLLQIEGIDGFLIGGASLDFQKFQKIVSLG